VLPTAFFSIFIAGILYPLSTLTIERGIICVLLLSILLMNLFLKKWWISLMIGTILFFIAFYFVFAVISDYKKIPDSTSFEALKLIIGGLVLFFSAMFMGILLCCPFKQKNSGIDILSVT
jgi:hypothetical protein